MTTAYGERINIQKKHHVYRKKTIRKKTVTNNVVSGSSGSGDRMLWELRDERVSNVSAATAVLLKLTSAPARCPEDDGTNSSKLS